MNRSVLDVWPLTM